MISHKCYGRSVRGKRTEVRCCVLDALRVRLGDVYVLPEGVRTVLS